MRIILAISHSLKTRKAKQLHPKKDAFSGASAEAFGFRAFLLGAAPHGLFSLRILTWI